MPFILGHDGHKRGHRVAWLDGQQRSNGNPLMVGEFVAYDSKLLLEAPARK
jgi:hypothetical protein